MPDDRITSTPMTPRCPACAAGFTATPGKPCPVCGRDSAPVNVPALPDLRRPPNPKTYRLRELFLVIFAVFLLVAAGVAAIANRFPGVFVPVAVLLVPAVIRTVRLASLPRAQAAKSVANYLLWSLLASFAVASIAGIASFIAFCAVCLPITASTLPSQGLGEILGGIVGVGLFLLLFYMLWPRESEDDAYKRSPDPEN